MSKKSIFVCDECGKESGRDFAKGFPYKDGWCFIYGLNLKFGDQDQRQLSDRHYCQKQCMLISISRVITEEKKEEKTNARKSN